MSGGIWIKLKNNGDGADEKNEKKNKKRKKLFHFYPLSFPKGRVTCSFIK
jgi:hypothetical protein